MDIQVERLRQALDLVSAAIPRGNPDKSGLPITTSVLFRDGKVTATNLEIWVSVDLPELGRASPSASLRALYDVLSAGRSLLSRLTRGPAEHDAREDRGQTVPVNQRMAKFNGKLPPQRPI